MQEFVPFIIILTFPFVLLLTYRIISKSKRLLFILDDKLLKSPIKLSTVLLAVAMFYLLYSYLIHLLFGVENPSGYIWNLVGLLVSASHFVKTKGAPLNYIILYIFTMLIGLFVYGIFISNLVGYVKERLKKIAKGRTRIVDENHILIIGISEYMYPIIDQYIEASIKIKEKHLVNLVFKSRLRKQKIVILSDQEPEKLMNVIEKRTTALKGKTYTSTMKKKYIRELEKKLIYRTGNTSSIHDLDLCNISKAATVIVLGSDEEKIKTILSIGATEFKSNEESFVISKFNNKEMLDIAERNDLSDEYDLIDINQLISSLTAQTTIQPNLSYIYNDLLDFNKTSIEFVRVEDKPELASLIGKSFNDASILISNAILLGIKNESITINPNADYDSVISKSDSLIIIRDPNSSISVNTQNAKLVNNTCINNLDYKFVKEDVNFIIVGFGQNISNLLDEFNNIIDSTSNVSLLFDEKYKKHISLDSFENKYDFDVQPHFFNNYSTFKELIETFDQGNDIDAIIVLPNEFLSKQQQDDETIFTLQNLKHLEKENSRDYNITIDLVEMANHNIIEHMNIADVIISDKFSSELIFQYATHRDIKKVYDELFNNYGDEIYSIPIGNYISDLSTQINFYTISKSALLKNQIAIGYKHNKEVIIQTNEKDKDILFTKEDHIVVIAKGH